MMVGSILCAMTIKTLGKRGLSLISISLSAVLSVSLGLYIAFQNELHFPIIFIILFITLGFTQVASNCIVPWILLGEIYPVK